MRCKMNREIVVISIIALLLIGASVIPALSAVQLSVNIKIKSSNTSDNSIVNAANDGDEETEYWAVLIGVDFNEKNGYLIIPFDENLILNSS